MTSDHQESDHTSISGYSVGSLSKFIWIRFSYVFTSRRRVLLTKLTFVRLLTDNTGEYLALKLATSNKFGDLTDTPAGQLFGKAA